MCVVSAVFDHGHDRWRVHPPQPLLPQPPVDLPPSPDRWPWGEQRKIGHTFPTPEEIKEFYGLLERARQWDAEHGEPECESEEKKKRLKDLADELGVEIEFPDGI